MVEPSLSDLMEATTANQRRAQCARVHTRGPGARHISPRLNLAGLWGNDVMRRRAKCIQILDAALMHFCFEGMLDKTQGNPR